jgi:3-oxoacyl-[acyl-carrier-protein] synthase-1
MTGAPVCIAGLGASTAVGRDAWSSAAAVRAGISGFSEHPWAIDSVGEPVRAAMAPWLDSGCAGIERFQALLFPAIDQALMPFVQASPGAVPVALALGLPAPRPGVPADLQQGLLERIRAHYPSVFASVAAFPNGHAAGLLASEAAVRQLAQGKARACIVAGVDSYIAEPAFEWLEESEQLHGAGPLNDAWGLIPGEAAGALLLMHGHDAARLRLCLLAHVLRVGLGVEPRRIKTDTVCLGEGLTAAFRAALEALPAGARITDVYCDMNGEAYRADEYGFAALRTREAFAAAGDFRAPADCWGDVAAAGGPLHMVLAVIAGIKAYARGNLALVSASAEAGERAAALLAVGGSA